MFNSDQTPRGEDRGLHRAVESHSQLRLPVKRDTSGVDAFSVNLSAQLASRETPRGESCHYDPTAGSQGGKSPSPRKANDAPATLEPTTASSGPETGWFSTRMLHDGQDPDVPKATALKDAPESSRRATRSYTADYSCAPRTPPSIHSAASPSSREKRTRAIPIDLPAPVGLPAPAEQAPVGPGPGGFTLARVRGCAYVMQPRDTRPPPPRLFAETLKADDVKPTFDDEEGGGEDDDDTRSLHVDDDSLRVDDNDDSDLRVCSGGCQKAFSEMVAEGQAADLRAIQQRYIATLEQTMLSPRDGASPDGASPVRPLGPSEANASRKGKFTVNLKGKADRQRQPSLLTKFARAAGLATTSDTAKVVVLPPSIGPASPVRATAEDVEPSPPPNPFLAPPAPMPALLAALGLRDIDVLNVWCGGSRLWGCASDASDYDVYVVHRSKEAEQRVATVRLEKPVRMDATLLHADEWAQRLRQHNPTWLLFLSHPYPWRLELDPAALGFDLAPDQLQAAMMQHSLREWSRVHRYFQSAPPDVTAGRETLIHLLRTYALVTQLVNGAGRVRDYRAGNAIRDEVLGYPETDWVWWRDQFQPRLSAINQELRRATKEERDLAS